MARLLSLTVGLPRDVTWNGKPVRTAIWKFPVEGRRMVRKLNIDGDAQADLDGHGGEQRAVFVYQTDSLFLENMRDGLRKWGVRAEHVHMEIFGALDGITPGMKRLNTLRTCYNNLRDLAPQSRLHAAAYCNRV